MSISMLSKQNYRVIFLIWIDVSGEVFRFLYITLSLFLSTRTQLKYAYIHEPSIHILSTRTVKIKTGSAVYPEALQQYKKLQAWRIAADTGNMDV
jgi:hypothetical protein